MSGFVRIKSGSYRNQAIADEVFPLVKHYQLGSKGGFITVDGTGRFTDSLQITGRTISTGGFTGSLAGTASWATNLVGGSTAFPYNGTAIITGSVVQQTGSAFFPTLNASESLAAGDFINITASFVRRASSNDTTKQAHG